MSTSRAFSFATLSRFISYDTATQQIITESANGIFVENGSVDVSNGGVIVETTIEAPGRKVANTTIAGTTIGTVDTFVKADYRSARYIITATNGTDYQTIHIMLQHDGTNVSVVQFASIFDNTELAVYSADIDSSDVRLRATPTNSGSTKFDFNVELVKS